MKIYYEVRWIMYHFNSGRGDNGHFPHKTRFDNLKEAKLLSDQLIEWITKPDTNNCEEYKEFLSREVWGGYLDRYDGIYKITEEKL